MRHRRFKGLLLALALIAYPGVAPAHASFATVTALDPGEVTRIHCFPEDKTWRFSFFETDLVSTPTWNPQRDSAPPLPLAKAIDRARGEVAKYVAKPQVWLLDHVELQQYRETGWWYYVVMFRLSDPTRTEAVSIPVLMDGTAIQGKRDPNYKPGGDGE